MRAATVPALRVRLVAAGAFAVCVLLTLLPGSAHAQAATGCRPLRAIFYAASDWLPLAEALAANASPCAQYYVSVPPVSADKTEMRSGVAPEIRALGSNIHALAEVNVSAWQSWVDSTGNSWYDAGVLARTEMAAAGFDVSAGDSWVVNEFSSAVRQGAGTARADMEQLVEGLYAGDGSTTPTQGVVFVEGIGQATSPLDVYKANLESWLQDAGFWSVMSSDVSDFLQENYGDIRDYAVAGADVPTRLGYLDQYLEHVIALSAVAPSTATAAAGFLQASYAPLANAAWAWSSSYGYTSVPYDQMEDYVAAQVDAMRSYNAQLGWSSDRLGFAWDPSNSLELSTSDFDTQTAAILAQLASAIALSADPGDPGAGACAAPWCTAVVTGAAFTPEWSTFADWTPTAPGFTSAAITVGAGSASSPLTIAPQIGGVVTALPIPTDVLLSSSSPGGSFSTSTDGPWTPTLDLTIPAGATSVTFYMLDLQGGTPTVTAAIGTESTIQVENVMPPVAAPTITSVSPMQAPTTGNVEVTVTGSGFATASGGTSFEFGSVTAGSVSCSSTTTCTVMVPPGAPGSAELSATVASVTSSGFGFSYYSPGLLRVTTSPALPSQITVDGVIADSWGLNWAEEPPGSHTVCFGAVPGYGTPACQLVTVTSGQTTAVMGTFSQHGYLQVETSPAVPGEITVRPQGSSTVMANDDWGVYTDMPAGSYQVCFGAVAGYTPPNCMSASVTAGSTTVVVGDYSAAPAASGQSGVGLLRVTTSPALASQITVDGSVADTWGLNWLEIAPGSHTVCFTAIQGYTTPGCQTVSVSSGQTTTVTGTFTERGFLQVVTSPAVAGTVFVDGVPADDWGLYTDLPADTYTLCFGAVSGYTAPSCENATVTAGALTQVTAPY